MYDGAKGSRRETMEHFNDQRSVSEEAVETEGGIHGHKPSMRAVQVKS